jgi:hypothetical protein
MDIVSSASSPKEIARLAAAEAAHAIVFRKATAAYKLLRQGPLNGNAAINVGLLFNAYCGMGAYRTDLDGEKIRALERRCPRDVKEARRRFVAVAGYIQGDIGLLPGTQTDWYAAF